MITNWQIVLVSSFAVPMAFMDISAAQQPQIPTLQVCNRTVVEGGGVVHLSDREDSGASITGTVSFEIGIKCDPKELPFPDGGFVLKVDMTDSIIGEVQALSLEQVTTTGKHTPTAYWNGRCESEEVRGCRFWMMATDNSENLSGTADILGFLVFNGEGQRVAYGTGPIVDGDIHVEATSF